MCHSFERCFAEGRLGLNDNFGDVQDFRNSWMEIKIPEVFVNFFSRLFYIDSNSIEEYEALENEHDEESEIGNHFQHERLMISNLFREVTDSISLVEGLNIHHEWSKTQTQSLEMKVNTMFRYMLQKGNPFDMIANPLHNLITKELVS